MVSCYTLKCMFYFRQLRQECLLNSYSDTGNVTQKNETTEGQNKALEESTTIISEFRTT